MARPARVHRMVAFVLVFSIPLVMYNTWLGAKVTKEDNNVNDQPLILSLQQHEEKGILSLSTTKMESHATSLKLGKESEKKGNSPEPIKTDEYSAAFQNDNRDDGSAPQIKTNSTISSTTVKVLSDNDSQELDRLQKKDKSTSPTERSSSNHFTSSTTTKTTNTTTTLALTVNKTKRFICPGDPNSTFYGCVDTVGVQGKWVYNPNRTFAAPICCSWDENLIAQNPPECMDTVAKKGNDYSGDPQGRHTLIGGKACYVGCQTHPDNYEWKSPGLPSFDPELTCKMLKQRNVLLIGDSTMQQIASTLMNALIPGGCQSQIRIIVSDTLTGRRFGAGSRGRPWAFQISHKRPDICILSTGAHVWGEAPYVQNIQEIVGNITDFQRTTPEVKVVWKTQNPGGCSSDISPHQNPEVAARNFEFVGNKYNHWQFYDRDLYAMALMEQHNIPVLDMRMLYLRSDMHPSSHASAAWDCLHFCSPGPLDVIAPLFQNLLIQLDYKNTNSNATDSSTAKEVFSDNELQELDRLQEKDESASPIERSSNKHSTSSTTTKTTNTATTLALTANKTKRFICPGDPNSTFYGCVDTVGVQGKWVYNPNRTFAAPICCSWDENLIAQNPPECMDTVAKKGNDYSGDPQGRHTLIGGKACYVGCQTHPDNYEWKSPGLPSFDPELTCKMLKQRNVLLIGDSTMQQIASTLMNALIPGGCQSQIRIIVSDTLTGRRFGAGSRGRPWAFQISHKRPDICILSTGAHVWGEAPYVQNIQEIVGNITDFQRTTPEVKVVWKTQNPGGCSSDISPHQNPEVAARNFEFVGNKYNHWQFYDRDLYAMALMEQHNIPVLDMRMLYLRSDMHPSSHASAAWDCLHFCSPGPMDVIAPLFQNLLIQLDSRDNTVSLS